MRNRRNEVMLVAKRFFDESISGPLVGSVLSISLLKSVRENRWRNGKEEQRE